MADINDKIKIAHVEGGDLRDQQALKRNYFRATDVNDTYQFFAPNDVLIETEPVVVATGYDFQFELKEMPGVTWTIRNFEIFDDRAKGNWTNTHQKDEEDGHFQAQAGGGVPGSTSSATAG